MFEITCGTPDRREMIVFEEARFGRNNTAIARACGTPFQETCDVDVHFLLNQKCGGREHCALAVNTALFRDPCGYEEFLHVKYKCVPGMIYACFESV